ncbi:CoxG family protein [Pandoraea bronchicola]|uniref:Carbon monoxide dehydrogenase n=1 Tax=Pandoraea bronchicola TaxID=2508287 RepID=A0A5E5BQY9_9BURK|nr:carbon monoxide dehydrogenase subunit G [Pandoraea bronchicola]VVE88731.1 carbon monoxide dehydrogenase [Pandoraea bronchicola]
MELQNSRQLPVARDVAWIALNDPGVLSGCIPGCESLERIDDTTWTIVIAASLGPVSGRWTGRITLSDVVAPISYTLNFDGLGSSAGHTRGKAAVTLQSQGPMNTLLTYHLKAQFGVESAHLDTPPVESEARKLADEFFRRLTAAIAPHHQLNDPVAADAEVAAALASQAGMSDMSSARRKMARWWPWAAAVLVLILIVLWGNHAG